MELVPTVISAGWAAGVNAYGTIAVLGLLGRAGVGEVPDPLTGTPVIATALVMFAIEFVVDKVAYLDSTWDVIQAPIRTAVGAAIGGAVRRRGGRVLDRRDAVGRRGRRHGAGQRRRQDRASGSGSTPRPSPPRTSS